MRTGFAFPILVGETCTRVMSFFTCEDLALDQPLLAMLAAVGQEIGHFLQRIRAEEQLKARVRQQAAVAELGQAALAGSVLPDLMDRATRLVAETLDVELYRSSNCCRVDGSSCSRAGSGGDRARSAEGK